MNLIDKIIKGDKFYKNLPDTIWESEYVCDLGIQDHIKEIQLIDNKYREYKNTDRSDFNLKELKEHFNKELMDLFIIINEKFSFDIDFYNELFNERLNKFKEKNNGNN